MNKERLIFSIGILRHFINNSLCLSNEINKMTGFELSSPLLEAAAYNTYLETVSNKADTLYLRIKEIVVPMITDAYLNYIRRLSEKFGWKDKEFMLAFDYTDENFYGEVQGLNIFGWTGEAGITGKFKFLTCSIVSDEIPQKIPLISIPVHLGQYKSQAINYCLYLINPFLGKIKLILFDRGFYDKDLMYEMIKLKLPFLIFVPKQKDKQEILYPLDKEEKITVIWDYKLNKDKSNYQFEAYLTFMKQVYDRNSDKAYDWVFASNIEEIELSKLIQTYKKRWRIETQFRVQDEAEIKCKSTEMNVRYFIFIFQQLLQTQWVCFYKDEVPFKKFIIEIHKTCNELVACPEKR